MSDKVVEIVRLAALVCDDTISSDEIACLSNLLVDDPDAQHCYLDHLRLDAALSWRADPPVLFAMRAVADDRQRVSVSDKVRPRILRFPGSVIRHTINSPVATTLLVAAVLYGLFGYLAWDLHSAKRPSFAGTDNLAIAVVRDAADVQWSKNAVSKPTESSVLPGESLQIDSGFVQLELNRGAMLVIEGPAEWSIDGENHATLRSGKLIAHVPTQAVGFTVDTPTAQVVDLGTEFGVEADASGQTKVEVFTGKVNVNYSSAVGVVQAARRTIRMSAGQAKQFSKREVDAEVTVIDTHPGMKNRPVKTLSTDARQELESDAASQRYAAAVLADQPLAYWRFSDGDTGVATDASGHGFHGSYHGAMRTNPSGLWPTSRDRCARFLGRENPGWLEMKDVEIPASYSAELWVRSESPLWHTDGWFLSSRAPRGLILGPILNDRTWQFAIFDEAAAQTNVSAHTPDKIDDRFHHYVGTYDTLTGRGCMYFDGKLVAEGQPLPADKLSREPRKLTLYIGRDEFFGRGWADGRGWVDEVAIYPTALSADAIRHHFEAARAGGDEEDPPRD